MCEKTWVETLANIRPIAMQQMNRYDRRSTEKSGVPSDFLKEYSCANGLFKLGGTPGDLVVIVNVHIPVGGNTSNCS